MTGAETIFLEQGVLGAALVLSLGVNAYLFRSLLGSMNARLDDKETHLKDVFTATSVLAATNDLLRGMRK